MNYFFTILLFSIVIALEGVHGRSFTQGQHLAYTSNDGLKYNCVNFYEQPAFSHPLLKHLVPEVRSNSTAPNQVTFNEGKDGCPEGTVPILSSSGENPPRLPQPQVHCYAVVKTKLDGSNRRFLATNAYPSLHKPEVQGHQWSAARLKLSAGPESIEAGWMVFPDYFKDNDAHLYVKYRAGASECLNTDCPGFVQVSQHSRLGSKPDHYSVYGGAQYSWNVTIEKEDGNWHLSITSNQLGKEDIGYWPGNLFTELQNSATQVEWGGEINNPDAVSPAPFMGSGFKAYESEKHAAYFRTISVLDVNYDDVISQGTEEFSDCPDLYVVRDAGDQGSGYGRIVFYGGKQSYD